MGMAFNGFRRETDALQNPYAISIQPFPSTTSPAPGQQFPVQPQPDAGGVASAPRDTRFLGRDGLGLSLLGGIADAIAQTNGGKAVFTPMMQQRREREWQLQEQQRREAAQAAQWRAQYDYKLAHPERTDLADRVDYLNGLKPGLGDTYAGNYANNGGGMPQVMNVPGVGIVAVPRPTSSAAPAPAGPPDAAISYLRQNPGMAAQFDAKYGAGASSRYLNGGAPSQGGATFP